MFAHSHIGLACHLISHRLISFCCSIDKRQCLVNRSGSILLCINQLKQICSSPPHTNTYRHVHTCICAYTNSQVFVCNSQSNLNYTHMGTKVFALLLSSKFEYTSRERCVEENNIFDKSCFFQ